MAKLSRRLLMKRASIGVGATGALAAAAAAGIHFGSTTSAGAQTTATTDAAEPTVICITNGTMTVMHGESEKIVNHPDLMRSLLSL